MAVIEIKGAHKTYRRWRKPPEHAVRGLDLTVEAGGVFGFLGPNGSGKTTTIRLCRPPGVRGQIRAALVVVPVVLIGFGLANLIKNTAAALGVAFVYLAVMESVLRAISPSLQPYQFTTSLLAWVNEGGITVYGDRVYDQTAGFVQPQEIHVSNLHGGVTMLVYALVVVGVSVALFRRSDIT